MVSLIESGYGWLCKKVPSLSENFPLPTGMNRTLACLFVANYYLKQNPDQGRHAATIATLSLQRNILNHTALTKWIGIKKTPGDLQQILVESQIPELICKVIAAAAFFFTRNISLIDTLTKVVSHSEIVSKVALPYLKRMASLPVPRPLQSVYVIALAPVVAKLIQIALICADPKGENSSLENIKSGANRVSQSLEFLLHLRYSLVCLGISKTFYHTIAKTVFYKSYFYVLNRFLSEGLESVVNTILFILKPYDSFKTRWNHFLDPISDFDFWPTSSFEIGVEGMYNSWYGSSAPYDVGALEKLFNEANGLNGTLNALGTFRTDIEAARSNITKAQKEGKIGESLAARLNALVEQRTLEKLETFLLDPSFATEIRQQKDTFLSIYWPTSNVRIYLESMGVLSSSTRNDDGQAFINFLKDIGTLTYTFSRMLDDYLSILKLEIKIKEWIQSGVLTSQIGTTCLNILNSKQKKIFSENLSGLLDRDLNEVVDLLKKIRIYLQTKGSHFDDIRTSVFNQLLAFSPDTFDADDLLKDNNEATLMALYGNKGLIHAFATTPQEKYQAYLASTQFLLTRFSLNLRWYMENRPTDEGEKVRFEYSLLQQLMQAQFDYDQIVGSPGYTAWVQTNPGSDSALLPAKTRVETYMHRSKDFDFARDVAFPIRNDFVFSTYLLPFILDLERRQVNSLGNTFASARNFEARFTKGLTETAPPPDLEERRNFELRLLQGLYEGQDLRDVFVPSADIRQAAK